MDSMIRGALGSKTGSLKAIDPRADAEQDHKKSEQEYRVDACRIWVWMQVHLPSGTWSHLTKMIQDDIEVSSR